MWILTLLENEDEQYTLLSDYDYIVARREGDIVNSDMSMSRKHAVVRVSHTEAHLPHPQKLPILTVEDTSKLGTVVEGVRFKTEKKMANSGDIIQFGSGQAQYRATYRPYVITTSCVDTVGKKETKQLLCKLGGHIVNDWRKECSLLVMNSLSVTVKVICALVSQKLIVTTQYLKDLIEAIQKKTKLPDPQDYVPPLAESQIMPSDRLFKKNPKRATLFTGLVFIFLSQKQFKKLHMAVELAGGTPMLMEDGNEDDDILVSQGSCVMLCDEALSAKSAAWVKRVMDTIKKHGRRPISDSELGFAVLYCSVDRYCNPLKEPGQPGVPPKSQSLSQNPVDVDSTRANTQTQGTSAKVKQEPITQSTPGQSRSTRGQTNIGNFFNKKRGREDDEDIPQAKVPKSEVKQEPVTPRQTRRRSPAPREKSPSPGPSTRNTRNRKSPSPGPSTRTTRNKKSPSPGPRSKSPAPKRRSPSPAKQIKSRQTKRSPVRLDDDVPDDTSHVSPKRSRGKAPSPVKEEKADRHFSQGDIFDTDMDFDSIPTSRRRRDRGKAKPPVEPTETKTESKASAENVTIKPANQSAAKSERSNENESKGKQPPAKTTTDVPISDFDQIPSHRSKHRNTTEPTTSAADPADFDSFDNVPRRRGKGAKEAPPKVEPKQEPVSSAIQESVFKVELEGTGDFVSKVEKSEVVSDNDINDGNERKPDVTNREPEEPIAGFVNAREPVSEGRILPDHIKEEGLPVGCMQIAEVPLLVSGTKKKHQRPQVDGDYVIWNGKRVKNFKKFRKNNAAGLGLPNIIGGSDLAAHERMYNKELEDWFNQSMQVESQNNEADRMARDLFDYEPPKKRGRR